MNSVGIGKSAATVTVRKEPPTDNTAEGSSQKEKRLKVESAFI